jgi:hypothetical protein
MSSNINLEEFLKALKTHVSRKIFPTTFMLVLPVSFACIS